MTTFSVGELANELSTSPKSIRAWMRLQDWRSLVEHGQPWLLTLEQVEQIRERFADGNSAKATLVSKTSNNDPLPDLTVAELLTNYRNVLASLRARGLVRTNNAPVGDLAEYCAAIVYDGLLAPNSEKSYDLVAEDDRRIQVKVRVIRPGTSKAAVFSPIRTFDFHAALFLLVDDERGEVEAARELSADEVRNCSRFIEHTNGYVLRVSQVRSLSVGTDLTEEFRVAWREMLAQ